MLTDLPRLLYVASTTICDSNEHRQREVEAGHAPWAWSAARCERYWAEQREGMPNGPDVYAGKDPTLTLEMMRFWMPEVIKEMSVVEFGCNAGANLATIRGFGHACVSGVELNREAAHWARVKNLCVVPTLWEAAPADVVFTMAVLMHIHPDHFESIAENLVRLATSYLVTVESETEWNAYHFPRNYRRVFERLGMEQVREAQGAHNTVLRLMRRIP